MENYNHNTFQLKAGLSLKLAYPNKYQIKFSLDLCEKFSDFESNFEELL